MGLTVWLVFPKRRVGTTNEYGEIAAFLPGLGTDAVARPSFNGQITGFQIEEQRVLLIQSPQQTGLADAGLAKDAALDAARLGQSLVSGNNRQAHE